MDSNLVNTKKQVQIISYPTDETADILAGFNEYLQNINLTNYQIDHPITVEDLYAHTDEIQKNIDNMRIGESNKVFK